MVMDILITTFLRQEPSDLYNICGTVEKTRYNDILILHPSRQGLSDLYNLYK